MANRRPDVLDYPTGTTVLRIFQAILSIIIIIAVSFTVSAGIFAGNGLMLFTVRVHYNFLLKELQQELGLPKYRARHMPNFVK